MEEIVRALDAAASPADALALGRYFQVKPGGYGEGDQFIGVKLGQLRVIAKPYARVGFVPADWLPLLHSPIHEHRLLALVVMADRASRGDPAEGECIYDSYRANTAAVNNWDLVDVSCGPIVGGYLLDRDRRPLDDLARSSSVWERRIAMVATQHFIRAGQTADVYRLALILVDDAHDLIHKAVGWMLREAGGRVDATELRAFLDRNASRMPRTALRYAIEHFPPTERAHYRQLKPSPGG